MMTDSARQREAPEQVGTVATANDMTKEEYVRLADFRAALRQLARQTELEVRTVGLTPQQYQLLLAIKGMPRRDWLNISELAERLQIRHNAVIGLVNRAEARGLVRRIQDADHADRRVVQVHLTQEGERQMTTLAMALHEERLRVRATMEALGAGIGANT
jgi:DNA-binding MarR family transcriptional regulator